MEGISTIAVNCTAPQDPLGVATWSWELDGHIFYNKIPECYDPSFCDAASPPELSKEVYSYEIPTEWSTYRYQDGKNITYRCANEGKYF